MQEGGGRTSPPSPLSLAHCSVTEVVLKKKKKKKVARRARHPGRCTFYTVLPVAGVKGQLPGLAAPPSSFLSGPMTTTLPPSRGVIGLQSLLLAASPVDTVVMSLPFGSTIGHPRPPQWAASLVYSFGEWGGMSHGGTVRQYEAEPPRLPLSTPQQRSLTLGLSRNGKIKRRKKNKKWSAEAADFIHLPDFEPKPLCHSAPTDKLSDQHENTVRTTTKDARFHLTRITHQHPCNKLNY